MDPLVEGLWWAAGALLALALVVVLAFRVGDGWALPAVAVHGVCFYRAQWCFLVKAQRGRR